MRKTKTLFYQSLEALVRYVIDIFIYHVKQRKQCSEVCQRECEGQTKRKRSASSEPENAKKRRVNEEETGEDHGRNTNTNDNREVLTKKRKFDDESDSESDREENESKKRPRDDHQVRQIPQTSGHRDISHSRLLIIEDKITGYLSALPAAQWRELTECMLKNVKDLVLNENDEFTISNLIKVIRCLFCGKLYDFSTDDFPLDTEDFTDAVISALRKAVNLQRLAFSLRLREEFKKGILLENLSHLRRLQILHFMAKDRYSFHWVLPTISKSCTSIKELKIMYDASEFEEGNNIRCLQSCSGLARLGLFSYSGRSELRDVACLLENLAHMKHFFHKELPNAIMTLFDKWASRRRGIASDSPGHHDHLKNDTQKAAETRGNDVCHNDDVADQLTEPAGVRGSRDETTREVLSLESLDLCCCQKGVGFQLMYLPSSYLESIAYLTPELKSLRIVSHSCLKDMIKRLKKLESLSLHNSDFLSILGPAVVGGFLTNIQDLELCDIVRLENNMLRLIGHNCKQLKSFAIIHSNFFDEGNLELPRFPFVSSDFSPSSPHSSSSFSSSSTKPLSFALGDAPFSSLSKLTLLFTPPVDRPFLSLPTTWQIGASHLRFLLGSSSVITSIRIEYRRGEGRGGALAGNALTEPTLLELFRVPRPFLASLELLFPPAVSCALIEVLLKSSPALEYVKDLNTWQIPPSEVDRILLNYGRRLDIT